jgi:cell division protein ZapA
MAEVSVEINGRKYRMACEDGQEDHLRSLAERFNSQLDGFKGNFGEIGDNRLTVMAGIAVIDELVEAEKKIAALEKELSDVTSAGQAMAEESDQLENKFATKMEEVARRLELVATAIDTAGQGHELER